ncbi:MAG: Macrolide export ATP-binding/permease protein MacB [Thermoanaerobaculia bacterium]|nr:Macrolide export ATP-binding/permease protein MacB [Thermoanaerobaculia bacterium]
MKVIWQMFLQSAHIAKKRAFLTIAAIAWGTVAILLLLSFGEGLKIQLNKNRRAMGERLAVMWPGETTKPWKGLPAGRPIRPTIDDIEYLSARMPELEAVIGEIYSWRTALGYGAKVVNGRVVGTNAVYGEARKHYPVAGGRFFSDVDVSERRRVVFLGDEIAADIFGKGDPVGKTLLLSNSPFTVIGVMQKKTQMGMYGGPDSKHVVIPVSTFKALFGRERLNVLVLQVKKDDDMKMALRRVNELLGAKYGYDPNDDRVLQTWDTVKSGKITANITIGIQLFLGIIGALTLLIGGVGVANIMYAVVKERTREIGVKMALGARSAWITGPFVLEGLLYTVLGGVAGLSIAMVIIAGLGLIPADGNKVMEFLGKPTLSWQIGVATSGILGLIGLAAGYFPARRAALIDPAQTLRYE